MKLKQYLVGGRIPFPLPKKIRPNVVVHNLKWDFHLTDGDYWPSIPHGHSLDSDRRLKLDVDTGLIYDVQTREVVGKASDKEMDALSKNKKFAAFVVKAKEEFEKRRVRHSQSRVIGYGRRQNRRAVVLRTVLECEITL